MSPDVHSLTGAYALDAVDDVERAQFERHLAECEACKQEVRELRETAARLGQDGTASAPPHLKGRVLASITQVRQLPPDVSPSGHLSGRLPGLPGRSERPAWALRLTTAAAAVLLVASAVLGVLLVRERQAGEQNQQVAAVLQAPDVQVFTGAMRAGGTATTIVSRAEDRAVLVTAGAAALPENRTYQAWIMRTTDTGEHTDIRSAGLLDGNQLAIDGLDTVDAIGLSIEPAGGSAQPTVEEIQVVFETRT